MTATPTTSATRRPRTTAVSAHDARRAVLTAQAVASLGLAAGGAAGGLLAVAVTGSEAAAAAPLGALVLGAGGSAPIATAVMARRGRTAGLRLGYLAGALGAAAVVLGAAIASMPWLLTGHAMLGAANTAAMLSRYVMADFSPPEYRGRAISTSMLTLTVGAVAGPNLLAPTSHVAITLGLPGPAGMYLLALVALLLASGQLAPTSWRHEPDATGRGATVGAPLPQATPTAMAPTGATRSHSRLAALAVLTTANIAMVGVMAVAPVHLAGHGHGFGVVGLLVGLHVGAMYVGSALIGRLVDTHGSRRVALAGALLFCAVGGLPVAVGDVGLGATSALLLTLGLAWNVQVVAGSALLHETTEPALRPRTEAHGELAMSLGAAGASLLLAGPLLAAGGLALLAGSTVPMHLLVLVILARPQRPTKEGPPMEITDTTTIAAPVDRVSHHFRAAA